METRPWEGDVTIGSSREPRWVVELNPQHCPPEGRRPQADVLRGAVSNNPPLGSHIRPRPAARGVAAPPRIPGHPLAASTPAYLTEAAPRPEVPAKRARGSPGCCVANESMEAGGGGSRGRGGSLGPAPQRASGRAERGRAEGAGQARAGTWGRGGSARSGGVRELGAERLTVPLRGCTDSGRPGSRATHRPTLRSHSVVGIRWGTAAILADAPGEGTCVSSAPPRPGGAGISSLGLLDG